MLENIQTRGYKEKIFHEYVSAILKEKGFKRKRNCYYRLVDNAFIQLIACGWRSEHNENLHFEFLPLYGNYFWFRKGILEKIDDLTAIPVPIESNPEITFEKQIEVLIKEIIPILEVVVNDKSLMQFCEKYKYTVRQQIYVELKNKKYDIACKKIKSEYKNRIKWEKGAIVRGERNAEDFDERVDHWKEIYEQELIILEAYENDNINKIDEILKDNESFNRNIFTEHYKLKI